MENESSITHNTLLEAQQPPIKNFIKSIVIGSRDSSAETSIGDGKEINNNFSFCVGEKKFNLILSDCLDAMKEIPSDSIDLVVTSPPYNKTGFRGGRRMNRMGDAWNKADIHYENFDDDMPEEDYQEWQIKVLNEMHRILKDGGSVAYNHKVRTNNYMASFPIEWLIKTNLKIRQEIVWDRGSTPELDNIRFLPTTERVYWLFKGAKPKYFNKEMSKHKEVWRINADSGNDHPAPFPKVLSDRLVVAFSQEGETVLDCFMGSGTVGISCADHKRNFIGIELNERFMNMAKKRISAMANQIKLF